MKPIIYLAVILFLNASLRLYRVSMPTTRFLNTQSSRMNNLRMALYSSESVYAYTLKLLSTMMNWLFWAASSPPDMSEFNPDVCSDGCSVVVPPFCEWRKDYMSWFTQNFLPA